MGAKHGRSTDVVTDHGGTVELPAVDQLPQDLGMDGDAQLLVDAPLGISKAQQVEEKTRRHPASAGTTRCQTAARLGVPWTSTTGGPSPRTPNAISPKDVCARSVRVSLTTLNVVPCCSSTGTPAVPTAASGGATGVKLTGDPSFTGGRGPPLR